MLPTRTESDPSPHGASRLDRGSAIPAYYPELLAIPVPRYTSYPPATEFHAELSASDMAAALDAVAPGTPASLYVHIPFCREICWYCGCNTGAANRAVRLNNYVETLLAEIALTGQQLRKKAAIQRVSFGGGSPNAIPPAAFLRICQAIEAAFGPAAEGLSIEIDPREFTPEWAGVLGAMGARRVSLGVQTLSEPIQRAIGRVQPLEMIELTLRRLRAIGVESVNFDLMYGLPNQTVDDLRDTLDQVTALAPDRIALFGYAHVPHLIPRQRRIDSASLPDAAKRFEQAVFGSRLLTRHGYQPIGFDHFAKPGDPIAHAWKSGALRRNFQGFTDDPCETLIGLGASAISNFPDRILQNEKNAGRYRMLVSGDVLPVARGLFRTREDRVHGAIIEKLLCYGRADIAALADPHALRARIMPFVEHGLVHWEGTVLHLAPDAAPYARVIAAAFDQYHRPDERRFSSAV